MTMKKKTSLFTWIIPVVLSCAALMFVSCSGATDENQDSPQNAYIRISLQESARTILPENPSALSFLNFTLYGAKSGEAIEELGTYESETDLASATVEVGIGTWTFVLFAEADSIAYKGTVTKDIQQGENSVHFSLTLSDHGTGAGNLAVTINCPSEDVKWVTSELILLEDESVIWTYSTASVESGMYSIQRESLPVGMYRLKMNFYADTEATLKLATYSELVRIATELTSTASRTIDKLNELYTITYNLNGGALAYGETAQEKCTRYNNDIQLPQLYKTGYEFLGWATADGDEKAFDGGDMVRIDGDTTFYALWQLVTYTITYELNGGTLDEENPSSYTIETETFELNAPIKTGYTFGGWYTYQSSSYYSGRTTRISKGSYGDKTLYAKWTPISYTITYNLNGGTNATENPASYTIESKTITLQNPSRTGYTFAGWYTDEDYSTTITEIPAGSTDNKTLYAKWELITYSISYELNGGTLDEENPANYTIETETFALNEPTKTGYTFGGWYTYQSSSYYSGKTTRISKGSYGDKTLYAKWSPTNYTITYNLNGGTNATENPASYTIESETIRLAPPTRTGYSFNGWYTTSDFSGTTMTEIANGSHENITLYAAWSAMKGVSVVVEEITDISVSKVADETGKIITFSAESGFETYIWKLDDTVQSDKEAYTLNTTGFRKGEYAITLEAKKGAIWYSYYVQISVQ